MANLMNLKLNGDFRPIEDPRRKCLYVLKVLKEVIHGQGADLQFSA